MKPPPIDFSAATRFVARWRRPLLVSHTRPDGDAIGSLVAMRAFLRAAGADPLAVIFDGIPYRYAFLDRDEPLRVLGRDVSVDDLARVDGVVIVDTASYGQVEPLGDWLRNTRPPCLVVDHHITRDLPAECWVVDESAAATCLILFDWARAARWPVDAATAEALFVGLGTDTGWFRHSNTDARALAAAADLAACGVSANHLAQRLFQSDHEARVRLLAEVLQSLELHCDGRLAITTLAASSIARLGARLSDSEDVVNEPLRIATVVASVFLVEQPPAAGAQVELRGVPQSGTETAPPIIRINFRSKAPLSPGDVDIDVAAIARSFGGGGHRRASGARVASTLGDAKSKVLAAMSAALRST